ncbi:MAG: hypothetical protein WC474_01060 [Hydrogenophilaceae bacterium]
MLLDNYEKDQLLYNSNFKEAAGAGWYAYRGDLVVVEGEIADAQGRRKPPVVGLIGAVMLTDESDKIKLLAGSLDDLADIKSMLEKYQAAFAPDVKVVLYVVNVAKPMIATLDGLNFVLIPMVDGMVWNELADELALEKSDFKGQSAGEKVRTVYDAFAGYKPKYETVTLAEAMARKTNAKRESRGPV